MRATTLVMDDEAQMRRLLRMVLENAGYRVLLAERGEEGLSLIRQYRPDLVLLDLGLPDMNGLAVLKRIREWNNVPVLILSVQDGDADKVTALDSGADDYITKPFFPGELLARLRVALRHREASAGPSVYQRGRLTVDLAERSVAVEGRKVALTATEYSLLSYFVRNAGRTLTHEQILRNVWGKEAEDKSLYLRVYLTHLRRKLEAVPGDPKLFVTVPGVGYQLAESLGPVN